MTFIALNSKPILCLIFQVNVHDDNPVQISEAIRSLDERYHLVNFSYYRNASGKYVTATTGSTVATSIYPTTVTGGSSTPGLATHYSSYPGGAVR